MACYNTVGSVDVLTFILLKYAFLITDSNGTMLFFLPLCNVKISHDRWFFPPQEVKEIHPLINIRR